MNKLSTLIFTLIAMVSFNSFAKPVTLTTAQGFNLKADYYRADKTSKRAVVMLHQCNYNRSMYNDIGKYLAKQGIHALSLDFRGFGESINDQFSVEKVRAIDDQKARRAAWRVMSAKWSEDVQQALNYLTDKLPKQHSIGVIGASCGGGQAITLAENNNVSAIAFFSSAQNDANIARYQTLFSEKPTLVIAAEQDTRTYSSGKKIFDLNQNEHSKLIAYKGGDHGYPLLDKDPLLAKTIAQWFDQQLTP